MCVTPSRCDAHFLGIAAVRARAGAGCVHHDVLQSNRPALYFACNLMHRYGLLLPHFGQHASRRNLLEMAQAAERFEFDSVWVRDHLVFHPHGMEGQDRTHVDPMVSLGLIAGVTDKLILGTGSLIPY